MDLQRLSETPPWDWPEGTHQKLLEILRDDETSESDRLLAAELAGDFTVINDELAAELLSIAGDGRRDPTLRAKAAISLGPILEHADMGFDDPDDVPITEETFEKVRTTLLEIYMDTEVPKETKRRTLEASIRSPLDWHEDAIREAYRSGDPEWKLTAVFCMRWVKGFEGEILESLRSEDPEIHYQAVCAAGTSELDAAWPHVAKLARSETTEKSLRLAAIEALGNIPREESHEILLELTESDDEEIAEAASEALAMAGILSGDDEEDEES